MEFAEAACIQGLKPLHQHIMPNGILPKVFPIAGHSRTFTESWIDEWRYMDILALVVSQRVNLYNAGVMINGRIYSVEVYSKVERAI